MLYQSQSKLNCVQTSCINRITGRILLAILVAHFAAGMVLGQYAGGFGTEEDPYQIATPVQMQALGANFLDWDKHFVLTENIDLSGYDGQSGRPVFNRIGLDSDHPFNGTFDGQSHTISNFTWTSSGTNFVGLFGYVGSNVLITNIVMDNAVIDHDWENYIGSLVGWNAGEISNCTVSSTITGYGGSQLGGLVGINYGKIACCLVNGNVNGSYQVGGLVGENGGEITSCSATGYVNGNLQRIGGLVGRNYGSISSCSATGNVNASYNDDNFTGGLVGENGGYIVLCWAAGNVNAAGNKVGGLVGYNGSTIANCYSLGNVTANDKAGGLVGDNHGPIENTYATGSVSANGVIDVGGLIGYNGFAVVAASFWNTDTAGQPRGVGFNNGGTVDEVYGVATVGMKQQATFTSVGWDFAMVWTIDEGVGYPELLALPDLTVEVLSTYIFMGAGQAFDIDVTVRNQGNAEAVPGSGDIVVSLYYSDTSSVDWDSLTSADIVGQFTMASVGIGESVSGSFSLVAPVARGSGYYRVSVDDTDAVFERDESNNSSDMVEVRVFEPDSYEPDDVYSQANSITTDGTAQTHSIDPRDDYDWVTFTLAEYSEITIETSGPAYADTYIVLYGSNGQTAIASDYNSGSDAFSRIVKGLMPGTYYVMIQENGQNSVIEEYTISVNGRAVQQDSFEPDDSYSQASSIATDGVQQSHVIDPIDDQDWVTFTLTGHSDVTIEGLSSLSGNIYIRLYGSDGQSCIRDAGCSTSPRINTDLLAGTYYVQVIGCNDSGVEQYTISVDAQLIIPDAFEPDDSYSQAGTISIDGAGQTHSINPRNDIDWVTFTLAEDSFVVIETAGPNPADTYIELYDSSVNYIASDNSSGEDEYSRIERILIAGTYYVRTFENGQDEIIDEYNIAVVATATEPQLVVENGSGSYVTSSAGQLIGFPLRTRNAGTADAGEFTTKLYMASSPEADWENLGPSAMVSEFNLSALVAGGSNNTSATFTAPANGIYYLRAKVDTSNSVAESNEADNWSPLAVLAVDTSYQYGGGSGSKTDPYQIATAIQFRMIGAIQSDWNKHFVVMADIDLAEYSGSQYNPIGNNSYLFSGSLNGNSHTISNFTWNSNSSYVGIFGYVGSAEISNVILENVNIENTGNYVGALAGYNYYGYILNCHVVSGTCKGREYVGGLIGQNYYGQVVCCSANIEVTGIGDYYWGNGMTGGLVGYNGSGEVSNCYATGDVSGSNNVGGLVGYSYGDVTNCYAEGDVTGSYDNIGGLIGSYSSTDLTRCYATGSVSGQNNVGGFVGALQNGGNVNQCYSTGAVNGAGKIGGLVGHTSGTCLVSDSFALGEVSGDSDIGGLVGYNESGGQFQRCYASGHVDETASNAGGLAGYNMGNFSVCLWDKTTTGKEIGIGYLYGGSVDIYGKTTTEMMQQATFESLGWQFATVWTIDEGNGYPQHVVAPDLVVIGSDVTIHVGPSESFDLDVRVVNNGNGAAEPGAGFVTKLYSNNSTSGWDSLGEASVVGQFSLVSLGAGDISEQSLSVPTPTGLGQRIYYRAKTDALNDVAETDEANWGPVITLYTAACDLTVSSMGSQSITAKIDDTVEIPVNLYNSSEIDAGGFITSLYISNDPGVDWQSLGPDAVVAEFSLGQLGHWNGQTTTVSVSVPESLGVYYIRAKADNNGTVTETNETNNWGVVVTLTVEDSGPDLTVMATGQDCYLATAGQAIDVSVQLYNRGDQEATASGDGFATSLYLSTDAEIVWDNLGSGAIVGEFNLSQLGPGANQTSIINITTPGAAGIYFLRAKTDNNNDVAEISENNNWGEIVVLAVDYTYGGGSGGPDSPYQIWTATQLYSLGLIKSDWDKHFILMSDIDLSSYEQIGLQPIGEYDDSFTGSFNGNGKVVSHFTYQSEEWSESVGMFGYLGQNALVKDLALEDVQIQAGSDSYYIGGLVGQNGGTVRGCSVSGYVSGGGYVGGLVGYNGDDNYEAAVSTITNCWAAVEVHGNERTGGFVGSNSGNIISCYATGIVSGGNNCYSIGGFAGHNGHCSGALMENCFATGSVSAGDYSQGIGGLSGWLGNGDILNCYSIGYVGVGEGCESVGGLVGYTCRGSVFGAFWDIETSGQTQSGAGLGRTTVEMQSKNTYIQAGWSFAGTTPGGVWAIADNVSYPVLTLLFQYSGGSGTVENPYLILSMLDLLLVETKPSSHFRMSSDIDLAGNTLSQSVIGKFPDNAFKGVFDGDGHFIRNLTIAGGVPDESGLFGYVSGPGTEIKNLGLENISIQANVSDYIGGLVGYNEQATIKNCYVSGTVVGNDYVGTLVGYNYAGTISNCFTLGNAEGIWFIGGMAGVNWQGSIENSCTASQINGFDADGGFLGYDNAGQFTGCFWNSEIAGVQSGIGEGFAAGLVGASTSELQTKQTFISAGWDFFDEDENGVAEIWRMCIDNEYYPRLTWQHHTCDLACPDGVEMADLAYLVECWLDNDSLDYARADLNSDNIVNLEDFTILASDYDGGEITEFVNLAEHWLETNTYGCNRADFNDDEVVNLADFAVLASNWLQHDLMAMAGASQTYSDSILITPMFLLPLSEQPERPDPAPLIH